MQAMFIIFATVFLAEIGDKTQLATLLFSAEGKVSPLRVFAASASALVLAAAIGVAAGQVVEPSPALHAGKPRRSAPPCRPRSG